MGLKLLLAAVYGALAITNLLLKKLIELPANVLQASQFMLTVGHQQFGSITGGAGSLVGGKFSKRYIYFVTDCHECRHTACGHSPGNLLGRKRRRQRDQPVAHKLLNF